MSTMLNILFVYRSACCIDWPLNAPCLLCISALCAWLMQLQHLTRSITNNNKYWFSFSFRDFSFSPPLSLSRSRVPSAACCTHLVCTAHRVCVPIMYLNFNSNLSKFISSSFFIWRARGIPCHAMFALLTLCTVRTANANRCTANARRMRCEYKRVYHM